ncbi:phosphoadenylyl-sulfate reductase [Haoranjiania flava]|uniref:Adenosine 5'-phosphosulfate reductase n=1 Tax=Haoranjiania flava TaxID=1856322 RepID=A0AAE3ISS9_9BACT|nr:phosphoadenylyl-sulfate reductase [Haoranjiania flava]MCU7695162.1 phosphoadenylyl-sulfate reductase [Haoranjiania flava]
MAERSEILLNSIAELNEVEALSFLANEFPGAVTFSSSFGMEDQVITHMILSGRLPISIFTLDTGRMFYETYYTWSQTNERYGTHIKPYYPDAAHIEAFVEANGINAFYESPAMRKQCCFIRKVEPLNRALSGNKVWVTGLRAEQSSSRESLPQLEWDETHGLYKFHPLMDWTTEQVRAYIKQNNVPYNPLHDQGFISIGCAPCTRAIKPGEDFRAGRWWWEDNSKKECGLHVHK